MLTEIPAKSDSYKIANYYIGKNGLRGCYGTILVNY